MLIPVDPFLMHRRIRRRFVTFPWPYWTTRTKAKLKPYIWEIFERQAWLREEGTR